MALPNEEVYALLEKAKHGDQVAYERLYENYENCIKAEYRRSGYFSDGYTHEDWLQEANTGFVRAVNSYKIGRSNFGAFVKLCVRRQLTTALKSISRLKHQPLNNAKSLEIYRDRNNSEKDREIMVTDQRVVDPLNIYINNEDVAGVMTWLRSSLSKYEMEILLLSIQGMSYSEIAEAVGRSSKSIDNALTRIRRKIAGGYQNS